MPRTEVRSIQIKDQSIERADLNTSVSGKAVITKVIAGTGISLSSTGADPGTGDVTISVNTSEISHSNLSNLNSDDHTIYVKINGRPGGQSIYGGTNASDNLELVSTTHTTKGKIKLSDNIIASGDLYFNKNNAYIGFEYSATSSAGRSLTISGEDKDAVNAGHLILRGGYVGTTGNNASGGNVYIYPGQGDTNGNVILCHNGSSIIGKVGIGTINPSDMLTINVGNLNINPLGIYINKTGYGNKTLDLVNVAGNTTEVGGVSFRLASGDFSAQFEAYHTGTAQAGIAQFGTYNQNSTITLYSGNTSFNIRNTYLDTYINSNTTTYDEIIKIYRRTTSTPANNIGGYIGFYISDLQSTNWPSRAASIGAVLTNVTSGQQTSDLIFSTKSNGGSVTEKVRITGDGKVGIGTTGPQAKLDVVGQTIVRGSGTYANNLNSADLHIGYGLANAGTSGEVARLALQPYGHTGGPFLFVNRDNSTTAFLDLRYGGSNLITVKHTGYVGIGTNDPQELLHVNGSICIPSNSRYYLTSGDYFGYGELYFITDTYIKLWNGSQALPRIFIKANNGNVGIDTTSPSEKLTVAGNILLNSGDNSTNYIKTPVAQSLVLEFGTEYQPDYGTRQLKLSVQGGGYVRFDYGGAGTYHYDTYGSVFHMGYGGIKLYNSGGFNNSYKLELESANGILLKGNVGIGTTNPDQKLVISDTGTIKFYANTVGDIQFSANARPHFASGDFNIYEGYVGGGILRLGINAGGNTFLVPNGGNVGIGTTSPSEKLEVNGNVKINGTLFATAKSFLIPHPTKSNKMLQYGSLEGPENAIYISGKLTLENKIKLPDYWQKLVDANTIRVLLTPIGEFQDLYIEKITSKSITVKNKNKYQPINCYYLIIAERKDIPKLEVEKDV